MAEAIVIFKSLCTRLLFFAHGILAIYLGQLFFRNSLLWICSLTLFALFLEMIYTLWWRRGQEYRYFWPSGFFYIITIIPIIWIFDMQTLNLISLEKSGPPVTFLNMKKDDVGRLIFELGLIIVIIFGRWLMPRGKLTRDQLSALLIGYVGTAADIVELKVETEIKEAGRVPMTMAVLGAYTWAILQFTLLTTATIKDRSNEIIKEKEKTKRKISMNLGHYNKVFPDNQPVSSPDPQGTKKRSTAFSFSSVVSNAMPALQEMSSKEKYIESIKRERTKAMDNMQNQRRNTYSRKTSSLDKNTQHPKRVPHKSTESFDAEADQKKSKMRKFHGELFQILVTLLMQDGPFLVLRLVLSVEFGIATEMHMLFLIKNAMVCTLLVYRLCILTCKADDAEETLLKEEAASKLHNVQLAVMAGSIMRSSSTRKVRKYSQEKS